MIHVKPLAHCQVHLWDGFFNLPKWWLQPVITIDAYNKYLLASNVFWLLRIWKVKKDGKRTWKHLIKPVGDQLVELKSKNRCVLLSPGRIQVFFILLNRRPWIHTFSPSSCPWLILVWTTGYWKGTCPGKEQQVLWSESWQVNNDTFKQVIRWGFNQGTI